MHAYWGFTGPKFAVTPKISSGKVVLKKKLKTLVKELFGINMSRSTRKAMLLDRSNNDTLWTEAIAKERAALISKGVFRFHPPNNIMPKKNQ